MGPAHRRHSHRSSAKARGYLPWYLLPAEARASKARRHPTRENPKKRRRHEGKACDEDDDEPRGPSALAARLLGLVLLAAAAWLLVR
mmetsp:Transcript_3599/g.11826  ORF Transcript_3599/g.11826 Transcript_3599/m.11826 type:complete len:87 (-) Transcript_3599:2436-2696(-)